MGKNILFFGATGYIGSAALDAIMGVAEADDTFTLLVRSNDKRAAFEMLEPRITAVHGDLDDHALVTRLAAQADVIINTADADNLAAVRAILAGAEKHKSDTGVAPILIHTSGTGTLSDTNAGTEAGTVIYTDWEADNTQKPPWRPVTTLPTTAFHRAVDMAVERADKSGIVRAYIVSPSTIYGLTANRFAANGLANPQSQQMPYLARVSIARGKAAMIGEGRNLWPNVHIDDQADLFALVYKHALKLGDDHGAHGYFFGESGEYALREANDEIGRVLAARGAIQDPTPVTLTSEEIDKYFGGSTYLGTNSRARGVHSLNIGWKPKHDNADFIASLAADCDYTIKSSRGKDKDGNYVFPPGYPILKNGVWTLPST